ncbi:uncharacterized protein BJX67DRAFT_361991 [Aspergillus lucknowensis]|uniref:Uncharacterized protein n=1 Tax=Aspergillus lucknowensis TaxID=176173 RepID=A0ABR4LID7_9EURO
MSENPADQIKDSVYAAASTLGEWAQTKMVNPIHSYLSAEKSPGPERIKINIPEDERELIDRMEKEKIAEFLREKYQSSAGTKRR